MQPDQAYVFHPQKREIEIRKWDLPAPWINYLSNGRMHGFVSQAGGGFLWRDNSVMFRMTRYRMYHQPIDSPGFYVYIRMPDGQVWSPSFRPCETPVEGWKAVHRPGSSTFSAQKDGLQAVLTLYMAQDVDALIWELELANQKGEGIACDVFAYVELSQMNWKQETFDGYYWRHMLKAWYDPALSAILYLCHSSVQAAKEQVPLVWFASDAPVESWRCDRDRFTGNYRSERNPIAVERGDCQNIDLPHGEPCAALQTRVALQGRESKTIHFFLGAQGNGLAAFEQARRETAEAAEKLRRPGETQRQYDRLNRWWETRFAAYQCTLPDWVLENQINTWSPVNSVDTYRYSRSVNANAAGLRGLGFRDSCQDSLATAYRAPEDAARLLRRLIPRQYADGHAAHMIPFDPQEPLPANCCSDDHLWLPFAVYAITAETGNTGFLEEVLPFLGEDGRSPDGEGTVWEHLMRGMAFTRSHLGRNGLPLTLDGDWNDIIHQFAPHGQGESVFCGMQYIAALRLMEQMAQLLQKAEDLAEIREQIGLQARAVERMAWCGDRWVRCTTDQGEKIGVPESRYGKLWLNPQSWAVIAGVGTREQREKGMETVYGNLNTGYGLRLLTPGFETWPRVADPFTGYNPGCGENGAVFCHSNTWAVIAEALLGHGDRAWEYFSQMTPHNAMQKLGLERYQGEPYAWASNIVGTESPKYGWANVMHISGTASWMDVAATQYLLGIRPRLDGLLIDPCIPGEWEGFTVIRRFRGCRLSIRVENPGRSGHGVAALQLDGREIPIGEYGALLPAEELEGRSEAQIRVVLA